MCGVAHGPGDFPALRQSLDFEEAADPFEKSKDEEMGRLRVLDQQISHARLLGPLGMRADPTENFLRDVSELAELDDFVDADHGVREDADSHVLGGILDQDVPDMPIGQQGQRSPMRFIHFFEKGTDGRKLFFRDVRISEQAGELPRRGNALERKGHRRRIRGKVLRSGRSGGGDAEP